MKFVSIRHSMPAGDLLSVLPGLKQIAESSNCKWIIYQMVDLPYGPSGAYPGAVYSIKDSSGTPVTMNMATFNALRPLLVKQSYIEDFRVWEGESVTFNLDELREQETTMPMGCINRYMNYIWPDAATDLSQEWLDVPYNIDARTTGKILINRTERYTNMLIDYNFLKKYGDNVLFIGLPAEHEVFCRQNKLAIERLDVKDYLEIATAMYNCKFFIGNQSSCFQISEGLKINRVLEVCRAIPNVIGSGPGFYDFLKQKHLEYYCEKLFNQ